MKHLKPFITFNENLGGGDIDITTITQAIGLLKSPPNEQIGAPAQFINNKLLNKEVILILEQIANGNKPNDSEIEKITPLLDFMSELQDRAKKDNSVQFWLAKYQNEGTKSVNLIDPIKSTLRTKPPKREKNPLFGN